MKTLNDLLNSYRGLRFLEARGVFADQGNFKAQLKTPVIQNLANFLGSENKMVIYAGQQIYVDYRWSVLSKIVTLRDLEKDHNLLPIFIWMDTDRSASDKLITRLAWPKPSKKGAVSIMPGTSSSSDVKDMELRFVPLKPEKLARAFNKLKTHLYQLGMKKKSTQHEKLQQLEKIFTHKNPGTLSEFNLRLTNFLLNSVFEYMPRSFILSDLLHENILTAEINLYINNLADVVKVFNQTIEELKKHDINPQVKPLPENYFPIYFSCQVDDKRIPLYHQIDGPDHFAVGVCKCGQEYRFYLGQNNLSIADIAKTHRWSPSVFIMVFMNDLVSGLLGGGSSALYGLIFNNVAHKVFGKKPVPILVPESVCGGQSDSLIYQYLMGKE